jgi:hypothetical protein
MGTRIGSGFGIFKGAGSGGGSSISLGTNRQIPYMNPAGNDFIYTDNFRFDGTTLTLSDGALGSGAKLWIDNNNINGIKIEGTFTGGIPNNIDSVADSSGSNSWNGLFTTTVTGTSPSIVQSIYARARDNAAGWSPLNISIKAAALFHGSWTDGLGYGISVVANESNSGDNIAGYFEAANAGAGNSYVLQLVDGNQGAGKVLTSDANGNASWQTASSVNTIYTADDVITGTGGTSNRRTVDFNGSDLIFKTSVSNRFRIWNGTGNIDNSLSFWDGGAGYMNASFYQWTLKANNGTVDAMKVQFNGETSFGRDVRFSNAVTNLPAAGTRVHITGNGSTSATTSLLVENSLGTELFKILDNGIISGNIPNFANTDLTLDANRTHSLNGYDLSLSNTTRAVFKVTDAGAVEVLNSTTNRGLLVQAGGVPSNNLRLYAASNAEYIKSNNTLRILAQNVHTAMFSAKRMSLNSTTLPIPSTLYIKGEGSTSATTALLVENSLSTSLLEIDDSGSIGIGIAPTTAYRMYISDASRSGILANVNGANATAVFGQNLSSSGTLNTGVIGSAGGSSAANTGVEGRASGTSTGINLGGYFRASGGTSNYAIRLVDGTEALGKVLKSDANGYGAWDGESEVLVVAASDETTDLTTGAAKVTFRMPYAMTLEDVRASVTTAPTGANLTCDINESGTSVLSTVISIDAGEKTSVTAVTPPVISDSALADDAEITIDIDQVGSTVAGTGLKVYLIGKRA